MTNPRTRSSFVPMFLLGTGLLGCVGAAAALMPLRECNACLGVGTFTFEEYSTFVLLRYGREPMLETHEVGTPRESVVAGCEGCDRKGRITLLRAWKQTPQEEVILPGVGRFLRAEFLFTKEDCRFFVDTMKSDPKPAMPNKKHRSAFVLLLCLGVILLGPSGYVCFVPTFECQATSFDNSIDRGRHWIFDAQGDEYFFWSCRECKGDLEVTLFERWITREDGVPPPGTKAVSRSGDRIMKDVAPK